MADNSFQTGNNDITLFAETDYRNQRSRFGIKTDDRRRHMYILGKTGMGKTNLLQNMAIYDIQAGRGVGVVDPHGEFVEALLDHVPKGRINDVIYFNPGDLDWPVAFNVLEKVQPEHRHLIASGVVGVFKKIWADSWGPRLEYVLRNGILALLENEGATLLGIMRVLIDKDFRKKIIARVQDPTVRTFWAEEFTKYPDRFQAEAVAPIQNKVGQFLSNPLIRNIVGQTTTAFNLRSVIDEGKILLLNLSKGRIGEDASSLLGAMMVTKLQLAAMSRVDVPEHERKDFYLYVDEFQNFATESFANILSEARKYRLDLILAHQYITQLPEEVRDAVFGNVGTLVSFRVGADDAEFLEREFNPEFTASDLVNLAKYNVYLKLMIDGLSSKAFSALTLAPHEKPKESFSEKIIRASRERYSTKREQVEEKIMRWYGLLHEASGTEAEAAPIKKPSGQLFKGACANCGRTALVPFEPDGVRPVWCDDCFAKIRTGEIASAPRLTPRPGSGLTVSRVEPPSAPAANAAPGPRAPAAERSAPRPVRAAQTAGNAARALPSVVGRTLTPSSRSGDRPSMLGLPRPNLRFSRLARQNSFVGSPRSGAKPGVDVEGLRQLLKETVAPKESETAFKQKGSAFKPGEVVRLNEK